MRYFHVDAFTSRPFHGNPAGVVPLEAWPADGVLLAMAAEHKHAETAFFVPIADDAVGADFHLRWFTPEVEVELCGHATLATAHVLRAHLGWKQDTIVFDSRSGALPVRFEGERIVLDFPARGVETVEDTGVIDAVCAAVGGRPEALYRSLYNLFAVYSHKRAVHELVPDMAAIAALDAFGVIVTAPGAGHDFVSRYFAPKAGVPEDPVTGSAHTTLGPYWAARLGKQTVTGHQVSARGGEVICTVDGDRVHLAGHALTYLTGEIVI